MKASHPNSSKTPPAACRHILKVNTDHQNIPDLLHLIFAGIILLSFFTAVAYSYRAELTPITLRLIQGIRGVGADTYQSHFFQIRNNSRASRSKINSTISVMETDYRTLLTYFDHTPDKPIPILITDGQLPAYADQGQLNLFYDGQTINLDTVPFSLVLLMQEQNINAPNLFLKGGYALYVIEEIDRAAGLGQSSDAWVLLLKQHQMMLPFGEAWDTRITSDEAGIFKAIRGLMQGGSFMRWVIETYGSEGAEALLNGQRLENVTGLYFDEAERRWLDALAEKGIKPQRCSVATLSKPIFQLFCQKLAGRP